MPAGGAAAAAVAMVAGGFPQSAGALDCASDQSGNRAVAAAAARSRPRRYRLVRRGRCVCAAEGVGVLAAQRLWAAAGADLAATDGAGDPGHHALDLLL